MGVMGGKIKLLRILKAINKAVSRLINNRSTEITS